MTTDHGTTVPPKDTNDSRTAKAQKAVSDAASSTVAAVKEHPYTAAAIAGGVAAAAAGAVIGAKKLNEASGSKESTKATSKK